MFERSSWQLKNTPPMVGYFIAWLLSGALIGSAVSPPPAFGGLSDRDGRDPAKLTIPERLGHVIDTFVPDSKPATRNSKLVIYLQDLHTQYDAQKALAELIEELRKSTNVSLIALEGGGRPWGHRVLLRLSRSGHQ